MLTSRKGALPSGVTFLQHGWLSANCVVIQRDLTVLVDGGHARTREQTERGLRSAGLSLRGLDVLLVTHGHSDHAGGAHAAQVCGAEVWAHPITATRVNAWDTDALWVRHCDQIHAQFTVDRQIEADEPVRLDGLSLVPIHTPGHASGMVALYCPEARLLISADALWENGFGPLNPFTEEGDVLADQRDTIRRLSELDVDVVLPGHGPPFRNLRAACDRAMSRLDAYAEDPRRLARHACKGYFVHHLLEVDGMPADEALPYMSRVPCYPAFAARYFPDETIEAVSQRILDELVGQEAIQDVGGVLIGRGSRPEAARGPGSSVS